MKMISDFRERFQRLASYSISRMLAFVWLLGVYLFTKCDKHCFVMTRYTRGKAYNNSLVILWFYSN